jgi:hypothetical protein
MQSKPKGIWLALMVVAIFTFAVTTHQGQHNPQQHIVADGGNPKPGGG